MTDRRTIQTVIVSLAFVTLVGLLSLVGLAVTDNADPLVLAPISAATTTALGALTGVLASTRSTPEPSTFGTAVITGS